MKQKELVKREEGNILIMSVVITALLVATGMSYMHWASDERWDSAFEEATVQAYFLAQTGVIEQGLQYLRTRDPGDLPQGKVPLPGRVVKDVGRYENTNVSRVPSMEEGNVFQRTDTYDVTSTGVAHFYGNRTKDDIVEVKRTATMRAKLRSFANYMYLTNRETTEFNEIIWFWTPDTLYGRTHSNDYIGLKLSPHFYGPISTSKDRFLYYNASPYFEYPPTFNAPPVYFPNTAQSIRSNAMHTYDSQNGQFRTWIHMTGNGGVQVFQYREGTPPNDSLIDSFGPPRWACVFVNGNCDVDGEVTGQFTIGCSGNMWLVDNVRYAGANERTGWFGNGQPDEGGMMHMLGLVSESNIIIRDNDRNGHENGAQYNDETRRSIIINAGLVALGSSFTFEHQNDDFEAYQGPTPDERGYIYLKGAVTQERRGYVHRSNHVGTGYGKSYNYDFRFDRRPPPYYLEATDENGHGLFDIISWGEQ